MKAAAIALALALGAAMGAQNAPVFEVTASNGEGRATIRNTAAAPLTAYLFEVLCEPCNPVEALQHRYRGYDAVTAPEGTPVAPGGSRSENAGACHCNKAGIHGPAKAALKAALYANGAAYGDAHWTKLLEEHRARWLRGMDAAIAALEGLRGQATREEALARVTQARERWANRQDGGPQVEFRDFDPFALAEGGLKSAGEGRVSEAAAEVARKVRAVRERARQ